VLAAVVVTVALSVLAHGVTASPLSRRYGSHASRLHPQRPERHPAARLPVRDLRAGRHALSESAKQPGREGR
jgi:hypothetical protein